MKLFFTSILLLLGINTIAQTAGPPIIYVLPKAVEKFIADKLKEYELDESLKIQYFDLSTRGYDDSAKTRIFHITICTKEIGRVYTYPYPFNSNRKVLIDTVLYPLVFDYDDIFGTTASDPGLIGGLNNRKPIPKVITAGTEFVIRFNQEGKIYKSGSYYLD